MRIELWQGTGDSHMLLGYADAPDKARYVRTADGKFFRSVYDSTKFVEIDVPAVTPELPDDGPTPGNWFGPPGVGQ